MLDWLFANTFTDQIINPNVTRDYVKKLCSAGSKVNLMILPNVGHGRAAQASTMAAVLPWGQFMGGCAPAVPVASSIASARILGNGIGFTP